MQTEAALGLIQGMAEEKTFQSFLKKKTSNLDFSVLSLGNISYTTYGIFPNAAQFSLVKNIILQQIL